MKKRIAPWIIALISAIVIHLLFINVLDRTHWLHFATTKHTTPSRFEVSLLSASDPKRSEQHALNQIPVTTEVEPPITSPTLLDRPDDFITERPSSSQQTDLDSDTPHVDFNQLKKSSLLDLSTITLQPETKNEDLNGVFSPTLQAQIKESQEVQKEYLKGQIKETDYPITEDSDGTRYVNIKGVCWRIPKEDSGESWVIVFAGCNGQTESFHFELNITPSTLLGPGSPFSIGE